MGIATIECKASVLEGETTSAGGAGAGVNVNVTFPKRSYTECNGGKCEVKAQRAQWNGGFKGSGNKDGKPMFEDQFEFICGAKKWVDEAFVINEGFVDAEIQPARVEINKQVLTLVAGDVACKHNPEWFALYEITTPTPVYVTEN